MADLEIVGGTDQPEPKPKRKYTRRKKWNRKAGLKPVKGPALEAIKSLDSATDLMAGLDHELCALACGEQGCVITGGICGHPRKGGLQPIYQQDAEILARFKRAQLHLYHLAAEAKKG